jgi:hypothetical protein
MKRNFAIIVALVAVGLALSSRPARAQSNAAVVIHDDFCDAFDGACATVVLTAPTGVSVTNSSGNSVYNCTGTLPAGTTLPPQGAAHCNYANTGVICDTGSGPTTDWDETVTPSGQYNLKCRVNGR